MFCKNCGTQLSDGAAFCPNCGTANVAIPCNNNLKFIAKAVAGITAIALVLLVIIVIVGAIGNALSAPDALAMCYIKDSNLYYTYPDDSTIKITKKLFEDKVNAYYNTYTYVDGWLHYIPSEEILIYPDKINEHGVTLYWFDVRLSQKNKSQSIKIDSDVKSYCTDIDGKYIYYVTHDDDKDEDTLYYYNFKKEIELATSSNINLFRTSDGNAFYLDGNLLHYNASLFSIKEDRKPKKIADDIAIIYPYRQMSEYVFSDGESLYLYDGAESYTKLNFFNVPDERFEIEFIDENDNIYYTVSENREFRYKDYIIDDCAESDKNIMMPDRNDRKYWATYYSYPLSNRYAKEYLKSGIGVLSSDGYSVEVCATTNSLFSTEMNAYYAKEDRDDFRDKIRNATFESYVDTLYVYNGKNSIELGDYFYSAESCNESLFVYSQYDTNSAGSFNLSDVYDIDIDALEELLHEKIFGVKLNYYVSAGNKGDLICESARLEQVIGDNAYYIIDDSNEKISGEFYTVSIANGKVGKAKKLADDVCAAIVTENGEIYTYRDAAQFGFDGYICDMYCGNKKLDSDVLICDDYDLWGSNFDENGNIYYMSDANENGEYTLKMSTGSKNIEIDDDVTSHIVLAFDRVYYSQLQEDGELLVVKSHSSKGEEEIDKDVSHICTVK